MPEDWIMLLALGAMLGSAIVTQLRLEYAYEVRDVASGIIPVPPTIFEDVYKAVRGIFAQVMLTQIGIYAIKLSCLIFFYRLGGRITEYLVHWWFVAIVTLACFAVSLGLFEYRCSLSSLDVVLSECSSKADINRMWRSAMISCVADAFSDVLRKAFVGDVFFFWITEQRADSVFPQSSVSPSPFSGILPSPCARG